MNPTEHQIQTAIMQYLRFKGFYVMRINSGKMRYEYKGVKRMMNLADAGTPDLLAFRQASQGVKVAQMLFVEVKRPNKKPTALQAAKMEELEGYGARCMIAHSVEDLEALGIC